MGYLDHVFLPGSGAKGPVTRLRDELMCARVDKTSDNLQVVNVVRKLDVNGEEIRLIFASRCKDELHSRLCTIQSRMHGYFDKYSKEAFSTYGFCKKAIQETFQRVEDAVRGDILNWKQEEASCVSSAATDSETEWSAGDDTDHIFKLEDKHWLPYLNTLMVAICRKDALVGGEGFIPIVVGPTVRQFEKQAKADISMGHIEDGDFVLILPSPQSSSLICELAQRFHSEPSERAVLQLASALSELDSADESTVFVAKLESV